VVQDLVLLVPGQALKLVWAVLRPNWAIQVKMSEILADVHLYKWYVVLGVSTGNSAHTPFSWSSVDGIRGGDRFDLWYFYARNKYYFLAMMRHDSDAHSYSRLHSTDTDTYEYYYQDVARGSFTCER